MGLLTRICWQVIAATCVFMLSAGIPTFYLKKHNIGLLKERMKPGNNIKTWDQVYWVIQVPLFYINAIVAVLDCNVYHWSNYSLTTQLIGLGIYCIGEAIFILCMITNSFFSLVVRLQDDRDQTVCKKGPYQIVRHPGYVGTILFTVGPSIMFGSTCGILVAMVTVLIMLIRTELEDRMLAKELKGYKEYQSEVRYKLIPLIY